MIQLLQKTLAGLAAGMLLLSGQSLPQQATAGQPEVTLSLESEGPGQIRWNDRGPGTWPVAAGTEVTIETEPETGSRLQELTLNGQPATPAEEKEDQKLTFTIEKDTTVRAIFRRALSLPDTGAFELTESQSALIQAYLAGDTESGLAQRKAMCEAYGLEDYVDDQYFLTDAYFDAFGLTGAVRGGMQILNPHPEGYRSQSRLRAAGTITDVNVHNWYYTGGFMSAGVWSVNLPGLGTRPAYCANGMYTDPPAGVPLQDPVSSQDSMLRKALYYGYGGPQNRMDGRGWSEAQQIIFTSDLTSMALTGQAIGNVVGGGWIWRDYSGPFWNEMKAWPEPPASFRVFVTQPEGSGTSWEGVERPYQPLAFYVDNPQGTLQLKKTSTQPALTDDNPGYSLAGAEYTVFDAAGKSQAVLKTDRTGSAGPVTLPYGAYTLKETRAPAGYETDKTVYPVTIDWNAQNASCAVNVRDEPSLLPADLLLKKTGRDDKGLAGAQFEVAYRKTKDGTPLRTWILASDKNGEIRLDKDHLVSGDAFWTRPDGKPGLPRGFVTIREVKAPAGYRIDATVRTFETSGLTVWKAPVIPNQPNDLTLLKQQTGTDTAIPGTVFERTGPDGVTEEQTTDAQGRLVFRNLKTGDHRIREKKAAAGYELTESEIVVTVTDTQILVNGKPAPESGLILENSPCDHELQILKKNSAGSVLEGATFTLYADKDCQNRIWSGTTDAQGLLLIPGIADDTDYWLKETEAPAGYRPDETPVQIRLKTVPAKNEAVLSVNGTEYTAPAHTDSVSLTMENGQVQASLVRVNQILSSLPETGSAAGLQIMTGVMILSALAFWLYRKEKR